MEVRASLRRLRYVFLMRQLFDMLDYIYYIPSPAEDAAAQQQDLAAALKERLKHIKARVRHRCDPGERYMAMNPSRKPYPLWERVDPNLGQASLSPFTPSPMLFPMRASLIAP